MQDCEEKVEIAKSFLGLRSTNQGNFKDLVNKERNKTRFGVTDNQCLAKSYSL